MLALTRWESWGPGEHAGPTGESQGGSDPLAEGRARALCSVEALVSFFSGLEKKISSSSGKKKRKKKKKKRKIKACPDFN